MTERTLAAGARSSGRNEATEFGEVNPFSLVEAVNAASSLAHSGWLVFLGGLAYVCIAAAGVSHKDLLLDTPVSLPILYVSIGLQRFFVFAPVVLVFMHFGLLLQYVMLARKVTEFDTAVRRMEPTARRTHPIRHELRSHFFTQSLAGPERSRLFGGFLHGMFWLSAVVMPVLAIVFVQIVYLPYHDITITWSHRLMLTLDIIMASLMAVFLGNRATSVASAFLRTLRHRPLSFLVTAGSYAAALLFSFLVATIPGEPLDQVARSLPNSMLNNAVAPDGRAAPSPVLTLTERYFGAYGTEQASGFFSRNLSVTDEAIVDRKTMSPGQATVSLRNRDLRYAELDRSDLEQVDFTGADLTGARLVGTNLRGVRLSCLDGDSELTDTDPRAAGCANLTGANLRHADLGGADLRLAPMTGASFEGAVLRQADLRYAKLTGADLSGADLREASLIGVDMIGANLSGANLAGADLKGAKLAAADFAGADMQATRLGFAQAEGANFQSARLQGATLGDAWLQGADFADADLTGADFGGALVWASRPPGKASTTLTDLSGIVLNEPTEKDVAALKAAAQAASGEVGAKLGKIAEQLSTGEGGAGWGAGSEATSWAALKQASMTADPAARRSDVANYLAKLACAAATADGSVATGVIRRMVDAPQRTDPVLLLRRLRAPDCPSFKRLPEQALIDLEAAIEKLGGTIQATGGAAAADPTPADPSATASAGPGP